MNPAGRDPPSEIAGVEATLQAIRAALREGRNTLALDRVRQSVDANDGSCTPALAYLGALASARMAAPDEAEAWIGRVDVSADPALAADILSLRGRIAKQRYAACRNADAAVAQSQLALAFDAYARAFDASRAAHAAINAATMAWLRGDRAQARAFAHAALESVRKEGGAAEPHWRHATRGEALLILGRNDEAREAYAAAHAAAGDRHGDIASMRGQLQLIGSDAARGLLDAIPAPRVIAFAGHMIDAPGRHAPRFPAWLEPQVARALAGVVARVGPAIGYAQAACGSDILFLEAMQAAGHATHIVLPCAVADYVASSVRFAGEHWVQRLERVLAHATSTSIATDEPLLGDDVLFTHASNLIEGIVRLHAADLRAEPMLVAVLDAASPSREGGTAATLATWRSRGAPVEVVDLAVLRAAAAGQLDEGDSRPTMVDESTKSPPGGGTGEPHAARTLKSLLFADLKGFSRLPEAYTPRFVETFLGICRRALDALGPAVVDANTRGDGLYVVVERASDAAQLALDLAQAIAAVDWTSLGLPGDTRVRVGLHTGPVFRTFDAVMNKPTYYGTHVNRTARLEPVVQPGEVFGTQSFAASLAAEDDARFRCVYIGEMPLAKRFGDERLYRIVDARYVAGTAIRR